MERSERDCRIGQLPIDRKGGAKGGRQIETEIAVRRRNDDSSSKGRISEITSMLAGKTVSLRAACEEKAQDTKSLRSSLKNGWESKRDELKERKEGQAFAKR